MTPVPDDAAYRRRAFAQAFAASLGAELLYLPPYPPNPNPIERVGRSVEGGCRRRG